MDPIRINSIVGKIKAARGMGEEDSPAPVPTSDAGMEGKSAAAEDIMKAIKSGSAAGLSSALSNFVSMCSYDNEEEESGE